MEEELMEEEWSRIENYDDYFISNQGRVKSFRRKHERILKNRDNGHGYCIVLLCNDRGQKSFKVHRLVAKYFVENRSNYPCVNHKDGDPKNNVFSNLEWCTYSQNILHAYRIGLKKERVGEDRHCSKLKEIDVKLIRLWVNKYKLSLNYIKLIFNVSRSCINHITKYRSWRHV